MGKEIKIINKIIEHGFTKEIMMDINNLDGDEKYRVFRKLDDLHRKRYLKFKEQVAERRKGGI